MGDWPNEGKLSALNIRRACDASLRRLRTDYIDLYQMHHVDRDKRLDDLFPGYRPAPEHYAW
jgi:aryl-alcohol dehydrogenase-like predicted oxidoreductase